MRRLFTGFNFNRINKGNLYLIGIIVLAAFLRFYQLTTVPIELFGDELDVGYQAFSLWTTGRDYFGHLLPTYLQSLNEWRAPALMYLTAPFVGIFGLTPFAVRLPAALMGILSVWLIYQLVYTISANRRLALLSAFVLALTPWHIHYSRAAFEVTLLLSALMLGVICFHQRRFVLSSIFFAISLYTYSTATVFVPLLVLYLIWSNRKSLKVNILISPALIGIVLLLPLISNVLFGQGSTRFSSISIFANPQTIDQIVFKRSTGSGPERLFHNKALSFGRSFGINYLTAFSPQFLFISGDPNPRHNLPIFGELLFVFLPLLLYGLWQSLTNRNQTSKLFLFWLLISPIPASLTIDGGNHATRLFLMLPPLVYFISLALASLKRSQLYLCIVVVLLAIIPWLHEYYIHYPAEQSRYWHYGYRQAFEKVSSIEDQYQKLVFNNVHEPILLRYLFWTKKDPKWFMTAYQSDKPTDNILPNFRGFKLGNAYFGEITSEKINWLVANLTPTTLYLAFQKDEVPGDWNWQTNPPAGIRVVETVLDPMSAQPYIYLLTGDN